MLACGDFRVWGCTLNPRPELRLGFMGRLVGLTCSLGYLQLSGVYPSTNGNRVPVNEWETWTFGATVGVLMGFRVQSDWKKVLMHIVQ